MSDKRTTYVLGTTIVGLTLVLATIVAFPAVMGVTTTETAVLGLMGSVTVVAVNPDGSSYYAQGDNTVLDGGLNVAGTPLFDGAVTTGTFSHVIVSTDANAANRLNQPTSVLAATSGALTEVYTHLDDVGVNVGAPCAGATSTCERIVATGTAADTATIVSVALSNSNDGAGEELSWVDIAGIPLTSGVTDITITYLISING